MEELIAESLQRLDETGDAGLRAFLDAHPAERAEIEAHLDALLRSGLLRHEPATPAAAVGCGIGDGEFVLGERLGGGGMGVVYRARQRSLDRDVAVKLIRPDRLHQSGARARFQREAATLAGLHHPGILPVFASGEDAGQPWFAMELIVGHNLDELCRHFAGRQPASLRADEVAAWLGAEPSPWRPGLRWHEFVAEWGAQAASALQAAHHHGIVHRDVKPSNLLLARDGRVLLFDFGLTTMVDTADLRLTGPDEPVGSPAYMAPEQVRGALGDPRSDVYGLGITLYELLALDLPFSLTSNAAPLREQIDAGIRIPLRHRNRRVPADLETIVETAMARAPQHRYASADALHDDLRRFLRGAPIHARRPGALRRWQRAARRHPARSTALLLALLLVIGGPLAFGWQQSRARDLIEAQRQAAERHLDLAIHSTERFLAEFGGDQLAHDSILDARGIALLAESVRLFETLHEQRQGDARVRGALARALRRSAWQERRRGRLAEAAEFAHRAVELVATATDPALRATQVHALRIAARIERARACPDAAEALLRRALEADADASSSPQTRRNLALARADLGRLRDERGASTEGLALLRQALAEYRASPETTAERSGADLENESQLLGCLALAERHVGNTAAAASSRRAKLDLIDSAGEAATPGLRAERIEVLIQDAEEALREGRREDARAIAVEACTVADELVDAHADIIGFRDRAIDAHLLAARAVAGQPLALDLHLGNVRQLLGGAHLDDREAAAVQVRMLRCRCDGHTTPAAHNALATALEALDQLCSPLPRRHEALTLSHGHQFLAVELQPAEPARALDHATRARDVVISVRQEFGADNGLDVALGYALASIADAHQALGDLDSAADAYLEALELRDALLVRFAGDDELWYAQAGTLCNAAFNAHVRGDLSLARGRADRAVSASRRSLAIRDDAARRDRLRAGLQLGAELALVAEEPRRAGESARDMLALGDVDAALGAAELFALTAGNTADPESESRWRDAAIEAVQAAVERGLADPERLIQSNRMRCLHSDRRFQLAVHAARAAGERR